MATIKFFTYAEESKSAPIYVKLSAGRQAPRLILKSGLYVDPERWSNKTETIKQRIRNDSDKKLIQKIDKLRTHIKTELDDLYDIPTLVWLQSVIDSCFKKQSAETKNLNDFITAYIKEAKSGEKKNKSERNFSPGTIRSWEGLKRIFNEYQGVYTEKRLKKLEKDNKKPRPLRILDFKDIKKTFIKNFTGFLSDEGYKQNTIGRFVKQLKFFMQKGLEDEKHSNRDFEFFKVIKVKYPVIALTEAEVEKIYKHDLHIYPRHELARDAFIMLCETTLRISDYKQDATIEEEDGMKYIHLFQRKTLGEVYIPCTPRAVAILKKYNGQFPRIHEVYINKYIKEVAQMAGINEKLTWPITKYGKIVDHSARKYELITCHTGRRTGATLMRQAGMKIDDIMIITGHKTQAQLMEYIGETQKEAGKRVGKNEYFTGNKLKVVG